MRTVYLGTTEFAASVLERLASSAHRPALVVTRPGPAQGPRAQAPAASGRRGRPGAGHRARPAGRRELGRGPRADRGGRARGARALRVRRADQGAAAVGRTSGSTCTRRCCRAGAAPRRWSGRSRPATSRPASRSWAWWRSSTPGRSTSPGAEPIRPDDDYGTLAPRLAALAGELLVKALDERPEPRGAARGGRHLRGEDLRRGPAPRPGPPRRGAGPHGEGPDAAHRRLGGDAPTTSGWACAPRAPATTPACRPASCAVRDSRLLLGTGDGALELVEVQPPGKRPMPAADYLRGHDPTTRHNRRM